LRKGFVLDKALSQTPAPFFKGAEESESPPYGQRFSRRNQSTSSAKALA
jgi:hypothetical protein